MSDLGELIEAAAQGKGKPVYLVEGDEYLARGAARELAETLVPEKDRALNLVLLDASAGAREVVAHLVTVAMFAAPKAVVVEGADAFAEEVDAERELSRARELWQAKRQRDAARRLLKLVRGAGWSAADLAFGSRSAPAAGRWRKEIGAAPEEADKAWLQELSAWAEEQRLSAPPEDLEALVQAVERGLPPRTHLVLVAESLPPKHALVRLAEACGAHLRRRAERRGRGIESLDIGEVVSAVLRPQGKKLARDAELELKQRLGDDLRLIAAELEKHAGAELRHALIIAKQIDYLGGTPAVVPKPVKLSDDPKALLRFDLENEAETIRQYRARVPQCEHLGEYAMSEHIREILMQEQEHLIDLATALGEDPPILR